MADEIRHSSNRQQVVVCHEDFIGLHKVHTINSDMLVAVLKDILLRLKLSISSYCGQCYNDAANMADCRNGSVIQICQEEERAVFTHCYGHALNLAVGDSVKQNKMLRDMLDTVRENSKLLKYRHEEMVCLSP